MRASGPAGELRVGYQWAATLRGWVLDVVATRPRAYRFTATVARQHDHWIDQGPKDLVVTVGTTEWRWPNVEVVRTGDVIEVELHDRPLVGERAAENGAER